MEKDELLSKLGQIYEIKKMTDPEPNLLSTELIAKMTIERCNKYNICSYCQELILDGKVFECPACLTLYHYNGFCNPVPFCYPCKSDLQLLKDFDYAWPQELFQKRSKSFLT